MTEEYGIPAWMKKATPYVYLRLSSEYQAKGDAGKPLDKQSWSIDQLEAVKGFLKANGMKMPKEANIFRDLFASITDIVGGRSGKYEQVLERARKEALGEMEAKAAQLGANAVVGVDIDYEVLGKAGSMLMVSCSGTAVQV